LSKKSKKHPKHGYSGVSSHAMNGRTLTPPLMQVPNVQLQSWLTDQVPEMLWAALVVTALDRAHALAVFRQVAMMIHHNPELSILGNITHTGLSSASGDALPAFLDTTLHDPAVAEALAPLALLNDLPGKDLWRERLPAVNEAAWDHLHQAVLSVYEHQSQEATDCRWAFVLAHAAAGCLHLGPETSHLAREIEGYPEFGDQRKVRPSIRSTEGALRSMLEQSADWPERFWSQCLHDTDCMVFWDSQSADAPDAPATGTTGPIVRETRERVVQLFHETLETTAVDARRDAVFGIALFALSMLEECLRLAASTSVHGRQLLRTMVECHIILAYMLKQDDSDQWLAYRSYGTGQAKLAFLKLSDNPAEGYVSLDVLERLANEDAWMEFSSMNLGHWASKDLRKLAIAAGLKDEYDRYYDWTSGFVHGQWHAVRDSEFIMCNNALHRLHRIPRETGRQLNDVVPDACAVVDGILDLLDTSYGPLGARVTAAG
jgi:hypothetical protein